MTILELTPDELLSTTRTVRKRLDLERDVPMEVVRECLELALQAPSGGNQQFWHWVVVTDAEKRAVIGEYYKRATLPYLDRAEATPGLTEQQRRMTSSSRHLAENMGQVPVLLIPCFEAPQWPEGSEQAAVLGSILPAVWSYCLAARSRGLGTAWTTLHLEYEEEVAEVLGLPAHVRQAALIPTAYTIGTDFKPGTRHDLDKVLHLEGW